MAEDPDLIAPRKAPAYMRPATRWIGTAFLLLDAGALVTQIAQQHDWARIHPTVGAVELLLSAAALSCLGIAVVSWRRRSSAAARNSA